MFKTVYSPLEGNSVHFMWTLLISSEFWTEIKVRKKCLTDKTFNNSIRQFAWDFIMLDHFYHAFIKFFLEDLALLNQTQS